MKYKIWSGLPSLQKFLLFIIIKLCYYIVEGLKLLVCKNMDGQLGCFRFVCVKKLKFVADLSCTSKTCANFEGYVVHVSFH